MDDCIFCKIAKGEIPTEFIYQDDKVMAFKDINPKAPVHILIVSKKHISEFIVLAPSDKTIWDEMIKQAAELIEKFDLKNKGYRLGLNGGGAALINHLHLHLLGGITAERKV